MKFSTIFYAAFGLPFISTALPGREATSEIKLFDSESIIGKQTMVGPYPSNPFYVSLLESNDATCQTPYRIQNILTDTCFTDGKTSTIYTCRKTTSISFQVFMNFFL
jgi:hypothetical protein